MILDYSDFASKFIQVWVVVAICIGLLLPRTAFFVWIRQKEQRRVLGLYLLVLIIQIVTEQVLSGVLFPVLWWLLEIYRAFGCYNMAGPTVDNYNRSNWHA